MPTTTAACVPTSRAIHRNKTLLAVVTPSRRRTRSQASDGVFLRLDNYFAGSSSASSLSLLITTNFLVLSHERLREEY